MKQRHPRDIEDLLGTLQALFSLLFSFGIYLHQPDPRFRADDEKYA